MNAVWRAARAAVRRRRLQTVVIGIVVWVATATMVTALGLLEASSAPFDKAFAEQNGAHLVAAFDRAKVSDAQLTQAGAESAAGPFAQVGLAVSQAGGTLTTVGRADPAGPVDRLNVWQGRWAAALGEIVLNRAPGSDVSVPLGSRVGSLTVVGFAYSVSDTADAWVTPAQMTALRPTATQMLYRFAKADTAADISAGEAAVTAGLPQGALLGSLSYLTVNERVGSELGVYIPFLMIFGFLGVVVAILIVANVVSGAVVAGFRHIGVLKALGFTSNQVMGVYLVMVSVPAVIGCVLGVVAGNVLAPPLVQESLEGFGATDFAVAPWVTVVALLAMPGLVALAALASALRARGLSAAEAISAGSAQSVGRALLIQRWLSGTRLPRSVSLGLGVPFARPARTGLTMAAIVLGVMTVTLAVGVVTSVTAYRDAVDQPANQFEVLAALPDGASMRVDPDGPESVAPKLSDSAAEALLRSQPGVEQVAADSVQRVGIAGGRQNATVRFSANADLGPRVLTGHWPDGPGQVAAPSRFLNQRGLKVGDTMTLELRGGRTQVQIVALVLANNSDTIFSNRETLRRLAPDARNTSYIVQFRPGTDLQALKTAVLAGDPGLHVLPPRNGGSDQAAVIISAATLLTLLLGAVAALGVFNTVVLNARERRRDLGMLKSIGMTPRQVTVMMVTSMGALGVLGGLVGLPLGVVVHRYLVPAMASAAQADAPDVLMNVYHAPGLVLLGLAGIVIAVLGAFIPARSAARTTIAEVLHNE